MFYASCAFIILIAAGGFMVQMLELPLDLAWWLPARRVLAVPAAEVLRTDAHTHEERMLEAANLLLALYFFRLGDSRLGGGWREEGGSGEEPTGEGGVNNGDSAQCNTLTSSATPSMSSGGWLGGLISLQQIAYQLHSDHWHLGFGLPRQLRHAHHVRQYRPLQLLCQLLPAGDPPSTTQPQPIIPAEAGQPSLPPHQTLVQARGTTHRP